MKTLSTYETVANAFSVAEIAEPLTLHFSPSDDADYVCMGLTAEVDAVGLIRDEERIYGYMTGDECRASDEGFERQTAADIAIPIRPDEIVAATLPIVDLIPLFQNHDFFFVLNRNDITHIVNFIDLDKAPVKLCLFSLFIELEEAMMYRLLQRAPTYLNHLSEGRLRKARDLCNQKHLKETPDNMLRCTTLIDRFKMYRCDPVLSKGLGVLGGKDWKGFFVNLQNLRNQIAHSGSISEVVSDGRGMGAFVFLLRALVSLVQAREEAEVNSQTT